MSEVEPSQRRTAAIAMLVFAALGFALLPSKAEGRSSAYVVFAIAFVVGLVGAAFVERRFRLSHQSHGKVDAVAIGGVVLIIAALRVPAVETVALGILSGALVGASSMILSERSKSGRSQGG